MLSSTYPLPPRHSSASAACPAARLQTQNFPIAVAMRRNACAAVSDAGALGIAQFTLDTADSYGVDPFDWQDAMAGSARLLASYVRQYDGRYPDPYAVALAAYNAGPGAVEQYGGVPPYAETRDYIEDVYDRWGRIVRDTLDPARDGPEPPPGRRRRGS